MSELIKLKFSGLMTILNKIPAPIVLDIFYGTKLENASIDIYFTTAEAVKVRRNPPLILIDEYFYPYFMEYDIKVDELRKTLTELRNEFLLLTGEDVLFFEHSMLAKDRDNNYYQVKHNPAFNEVKQAEMNTNLFFNNLKPDWKRFGTCNE